ncbi:MAG TPA: hypothetical protein VGL21_01770 [Jatrophihabitantaceae bacterium]
MTSPRVARSVDVAPQTFLIRSISERFLMVVVSASLRARSGAFAIVLTLLEPLAATVLARPAVVLTG